MLIWNTRRRGCSIWWGRSGSKGLIKIKGVGLTASVSPSASYLEKHPPLGFKEQPRVPAPGWARLRRNTLTPTTLRGPAPNGHPCPDGALAASLRLGPLRVVYVRPAPKSRLAVTEPFVYEDQKQIKARIVGPALAGKRVVQAPTFDRSLRSASQGSLTGCGAFVGPASAGKRAVCTPSILRRTTRRFPD